MSTQTLDQTKPLAKELGAEAVKTALCSPSPQTATHSYPVTITIFEQYGKAFLSWVLDPNYAVGPNDNIQLREGSTWVKNWPIKTISGTLDTNHVWGSGLNASYWTISYTDSSWRQLVITPDT